MTTQSNNEIVKRQENKSELQDLSTLLDELVDYGSNLLDWFNVRKDVDFVPLAMLRIAIQDADSISVLLKNGIVDPARLIFRSFIENYLHLKFILQKNEDQYCLNFLYCIFAEKIKTYRARLKVLNADSESQLERKNYENIQRGLDDYNKKIQSDLFEESKQEYDRLNKPKINKNGKKYSQKFSWFTMHHPIEPRDLRNLAKCLESESLYTDWYKPLSSSTHAVDIISERIIQTDNPEKPVAMRPIRSYHSLVAKNIAIDAAISMIFLYDGFIKNFIPKELENFRIWSLKIEKHIELLDKERSEFFLKREYNITS